VLALVLYLVAAITSLSYRHFSVYWHSCSVIYRRFSTTLSNISCWL